MTVLVLVEHDKARLSPATLCTVAAASKLGGEVHLLVAGSGCKQAAEAAAKVAGVTKVLLADNALYAVSQADLQIADNDLPRDPLSGLRRQCLVDTKA